MAVRGKKRLGDLLVEAGAITPEQLQEVLKQQKKSDARLGKTIVDMGLLSDDRLVHILARQLGIEVTELENVEPDATLLKLIPEATARKYRLLPIEKDGNTITLVMADPLNLFAIDEVSIKLGCEIKVTIASENQIERAVTKHYCITSSIQEAMRSLGETDIKTGEKNLDVADIAAVPTEIAPVAKLVEIIIREAVSDRASDIHLEPDEENLIIRNRIDGLLFTGMVIPKRLQAAIISRIKVISHMDIAETRTPQDGRFKMIHNERPVEFRVSTFPTIYGENVVIRILHIDAIMTQLSKTGLSGTSLNKALRLFKAPFGIVIVTGPTGSGKTTTLYAALNLLNTVAKNIITIEDPVEYRLPGIRQSQVNIKAGLNFANSLRSILRQDPDIIMVGEIRDLETAELAIQAAMTGHLVLATLHTNDASSAMVRLIDLGIEPFLISSGLVGVIAQRLVRTVCEKCKRPLTREEALAKTPNLAGQTLYTGIGCTECKKSGYAGRTGIFEVLMMDDNLKSLISRSATSATIREYACKKQKMIDMREDGLNKMLKGVTTLEEVNRVTADI